MMAFRMLMKMGEIEVAQVEPFLLKIFGAGARTSTPYTNYTYEPNDWLNDGGSVNDGEYAILSDIQNSASWAASAWVDKPDHTEY
ncbi:MAG: hypothetical protein R2821_02290 [Flavobacteriaceae bacterium]